MFGLGRAVSKLFGCGGAEKEGPFDYLLRLPPSDVAASLSEASLNCKTGLGDAIEKETIKGNQAFSGAYVGGKANYGYSLIGDLRAFEDEGARARSDIKFVNQLAEWVKSHPGAEIEDIRLHMDKMAALSEHTPAGLDWLMACVSFKQENGSLPSDTLELELPITDEERRCRLATEAGGGAAFGHRSRKGNHYQIRNFYGAFNNGDPEAGGINHILAQYAIYCAMHKEKYPWRQEDQTSMSVVAGKEFIPSAACLNLWSLVCSKEPGRAYNPTYTGPARLVQPEDPYQYASNAHFESPTVARAREGYTTEGGNVVRFIAYKGTPLESGGWSFNEQHLRYAEILCDVDDEHPTEEIHTTRGIRIWGMPYKKTEGNQKEDRAKAFFFGALQISKETDPNKRAARTPLPMLRPAATEWEQKGDNSNIQNNIAHEGIYYDDEGHFIAHHEFLTGTFEPGEESFDENIEELTIRIANWIQDHEKDWVITDEKDDQGNILEKGLEVHIMHGEGAFTHGSAASQRFRVFVRGKDRNYAAKTGLYEPFHERFIRNPIQRQDLADEVQIRSHQAWEGFEAGDDAFFLLDIPHPSPIGDIGYNPRENTLEALLRFAEWGHEHQHLYDIKHLQIISRWEKHLRPYASEPGYDHIFLVHAKKKAPPPNP